MKINLGAGTDIQAGYVNHDITQLENIDVVHDLNQRPWPWEEKSVDFILAKDVIEHLNDFVPTMEEIYRIVKPGGVLKLSVPYWNSAFAQIDPTHRRGFHEMTFRFFDPSSPFCQERGYYSHARFEIVSEAFVISPFSPYFQIPGLRLKRVRSRLGKRVLGFISNFFSNIILDLELELKRI